MSTLGNSVGPKQWDTYDKAEVNEAIAVVDAKVDGANTALANVYTKTETDTQISTAVGSIDLSSKQDVLVSGTNIKTIAGNSVLGSGDIPASVFGSATDYQEFTTSGTWTKPDGINFVYVEAIGGGAGGSGGQGLFGGGGGGFSNKVLIADNVTSTVSVTIGAGGLGGTTTYTVNGGGNSSFGTYLAAKGGVTGSSSDGYGRAGGGEYMLMNGSIGITTLGGYSSGAGGNQGAGGPSVKGGAGGGGIYQTNDYNGGISQDGGNGGNAGATGGNGKVPGGGGGGGRGTGNNGTGGNGASGRVRVWAW